MIKDIPKSKKKMKQKISYEYLKLLTYMLKRSGPPGSPLHENLLLLTLNGTQNDNI